MKAWTLLLVVLALASGCKTVDGLLQKSGGSSVPSPSVPTPSVGSRTPRSDANDRMENERGEKLRTSLDSVAVIDPAPGAAKVGPTKPTCCEAVPREELQQATASSASRLMRDMKERGYWWNHTPGVLFALCVNPDDDKVKEQTGYFLQYWVNLTGLPPDQLTPFFRVFAGGARQDGDRYKAALTEACAKFPKPSDEAPPRDRSLKTAERASLGCEHHEGIPYWASHSGGVDVSWYLDVAAEPPSELLRSYFVLGCLRDRDKLEEEDLAGYAVCGMDARTLSSEKLEKQIAAYPELSKVFARQQHSVARQLAKRYEELAQASSKADPAWKTMLYDAPAKAWKEWDAEYKRHQKAIDAARAYENVYNGPSKNAAKGCWNEAWGNFTGFVASYKPATIDEAKRAMTGTVAAILLEHLVACTRAENLVMLSPAMRLFEAARPARGPRFASYYAVIDALNDIKSGRSKFNADARWFSHTFTGRSPLGGGNGSLDRLDPDDKGGVVKSVTSADGGVLVEFKTERWQEDRHECEDTTRVRQIKPDGTLVYDRKCKYVGKEWVENTHYPVWVAGDLAASIKPGTFVRLFSGGGQHKATKAQISVPIEVWDSKDRKRLMSYVAVPLAAR